ncbi:hypothetical protein GCM10027051_06670 [Niabella terrae]
MFVLDNIDSIRKKVITIVRSLSPEALNTIPEGFNNNIAWNFGHIVVSGYSLVFKATGADPDFSIPYVELFRKGSKPGEPVSAAQVEALIELSDRFTTTVKKALTQEESFRDITAYTTGTFGVSVTTINDMLVTVAMHDTCHWQTIRDYQRILALRQENPRVAS